jgi:4-amino-4-deoxy-L-arabinose transferase-like glycosyltransferase
MPRLPRLGDWLVDGAAAEQLDRFISAITDPARRERTVPTLIAAYVFVWTIYGTIAKGSQDVHFDMGEAVVWSRAVTLGTPKHPPFSAWLAGGWFSVFPCRDWAFYLLAMTMAGVALWFAWRLSMQYLSGDKLALATVLLTFVPFYNFHALKFNANTVMTPLWAFATWSFVNSFRERTFGWAALAGLAAAAVMLGKYWGLFLLLGLGISALIDPRRGTYFRSSAPWISVVVGSLAIAPHLAWVATHHFVTFSYAMNSHYDSLNDVLKSSLLYLPQALAYVCAPVLFAGLASRSVSFTTRNLVLPRDPDRQLALSILLLPLVMPPVAGLIAHSGETALWTMGGWTLLPVVLLSSPALQVSRLLTRRTIAIAIVFPFIAIAVAPIAAFLIHRKGPDNHMSDYQLLATAMEQVWHDTTDKPLKFIGGDTGLTNGIAFYAADAPVTSDIFRPDLTPWADSDRIKREGIAWVCPAADKLCLDAVMTKTAGSRVGKHVEVPISRSYMGVPSPTTRYVIVTTPPQKE